MICVHIIFQITLGLNVATYSTSLLIHLGISKFLARISTFIIGIVAVSGTIVFTGISDFFGRKIILSYTLTLCFFTNI